MMMSSICRRSLLSFFNNLRLVLKMANTEGKEKPAAVVQHAEEDDDEPDEWYVLLALLDASLSVALG